MTYTQFPSPEPKVFKRSDKRKTYYTMKGNQPKIQNINNNDRRFNSLALPHGTSIASELFIHELNTLLLKSEKIDHFIYSKLQGIGALTAKSLANELGVSTQPVFTCFHTIEEVRREVVNAAKILYDDYVKEGLCNDIPFLGFGMHYIRFAKEEPELYRLLFLSMDQSDGKNLEQSILEKFDELDEITEIAKKNRTDIKELFREMQNNYQKVGIVKYDAFNEMGGKLSFALTLLDGNNSGWVINAMHSREGCYTYIKEIVRGESYIELAEEEAESLEQAIYQEVYDPDVQSVMK